MFTRNRVIMTGDFAHIFDLSSLIERWPVILPHYRYVRLLDQSSDGLQRRAVMSAWRNILPVSWKTLQTIIPPQNGNADSARILYIHIGGVTKGMEVEWIFRTLSEGRYEVSITHDWQPNWPLVGNIAARLIGRFIVANIADKTLATIKKRVENRLAAEPGSSEKVGTH